MANPPNQLPNYPVPDLPYESMMPEARALLLEMFGRINHARNDFRLVWDSIPYSPELDRSAIDRAGRSFGVLEAGMVHMRIVPERGCLNGVVYSDLLAEGKHYPAPSIWLTGEASLANVHALHIGTNDAPVFRVTPVDHLLVIIHTRLDEITEFRDLVKKRMGRMVSLVKLAHTMSYNVRGKPDYFMMSATSRDKFVVRCIDQITHLRMQVERIQVNEGECIGFRVNPAWGGTAMEWEASDYNPETWDPLESQVAWEPQDVGRKFTVYAWNTMGVQNAAFEDCLRFVQATVDPRMIVFTQPGDRTEVISRIMTILGWSGNWVCEREGGMWIVWDNKALNVRFLQADDDGAHMVITEKAA